MTAKAIKCALEDLFFAEEKPTNHRFKDLTGHIFSRLTVVSYAGVTSGGDRHSKWLCLCECGTLTTVDGSKLNSGNTKSCGCQQRESVIARNTTHGESSTYLYETWANIIQRVTNQNLSNAHRYSKRGITISEEFKTFTGFRDYVQANLGPRPEGYSIDRVNNMGNYEPGNLRWASRTEQGRNKENNKMVQYNGEQITISELQERYAPNISYDVVRGRIRLGWPIEKALDTPVERR